MQASVSSVVTHWYPHLDELASKWALDRFGEARYPGILEAPFEVFQPDKHLDGRPEEDWLKDGVLFLGVRGGKFDDHPHEQYPNDCCFTLILKDLGVHKDPSLRDISRHILTEDRNGAPHPFHLASVVKRMHRTHGVGDVYTAVQTALEGLYAEQVEFQEALEIVRDADLRNVINARSQKALRLCIVDGYDHESISRAARFKDGVDASLVIHRNSKGKVLVCGSKRQGVSNFAPLVGALRRLEQEVQGRPPITEPTKLQADGVLPEVPEWYYLGGGEMILNGSLTAPHVPASRIPLEKIAEECTAFLRSTVLSPVGRQQ